MQTNLFNSQSKYGPNTNFGFQADPATEYLRTSTGEALPYKLFSGRDDPHAGSSILRENPGDRYSNDFALVERQFSENKGLSFSAGTRVSDVNDVAWLFRALEDEAVEHTFALYKFKDDSYLVQHLSSGGITSTVVDLRLLTGNAFRLQPESITLVHNHPSGQLVSSRHDRLMLERLNDIFRSTDIKIEDGIVINLRSGKYLVFTAENNSDRILSMKKQEQPQEEIATYSFSKQIFAANYQPFRITGPEDTAAYISAQKFGLSDKTEAMILNNANEIVGKFILPQQRQFEKLTELLTIHAGTAVILYGNNVNEEMFQDYKKRLDMIGFTALDAIRLESRNYYSVFQKSEIDVRDNLVSKFKSGSVSAEPGNSYQSGSKFKEPTESSKSFFQNPPLNLQEPSNSYNNIKTNIMDTKSFDTAQFLKDQMKYLGFGEGEQLHKDLEKGLGSEEKQFEIKTVSDRTLPGNRMDFFLKFNKSDQGGVFLNSYRAELTNEQNEKHVHNFSVGKENSYTAKEAVNLLEGRAVKTEFKNPETEKPSPAFVKLKLNEEKNDYGNYKLEVYNENYGVDTAKIVDKAGLVFDKPEYRDNVIKSLEKGNVVKVKFSQDNQIVEGKAVLNPQYKNLNLYDSEMNRINTNKPLKGMEQENQEKTQVKQQSMSRSL